MRASILAAALLAISNCAVGAPVLAGDFAHRDGPIPAWQPVALPSDELLLSGTPLGELLAPQGSLTADVLEEPAGPAERQNPWLLAIGVAALICATRRRRSR